MYHRVLLDCLRTCVSFARDQGRLVYQGIRTQKGILVISVLQAEELLEKGNEAYFATITVEGGDAWKRLETIHVVIEYIDVFEALQEPPPTRGDAFTIELEPGTTPCQRHPTG